GEAQLPLALVDLAEVLRRGAGLHVVDGDPVDIALEDRGQLSTERVVRSRGAAGSEGEVVSGLTAAAFTPTGSAGGQGQGERSNGRCGDASNRHCLPFSAGSMASAPLLSDRSLISDRKSTRLTY